MHGDGWNGWLFLSESTDEHAWKFCYNLKERRKEAQDTRNRSTRVNTPKPWETDLQDPLQHSDTSMKIYDHFLMSAKKCWKVLLWDVFYFTIITPNDEYEKFVTTHLEAAA